MAVPASGTVSLDDIQTEFGGANPVSLSEYYRDGTYVTSNNTGVPTSGAVSVSDFYGAVKQFIFTITANTQEADLATLATAAGWDGVAPIAATIDSGVYLWSDDVAVGGLAVASVPTGTTVDNYGYIIGRGGDGGFRTIAPQSGGPALINSVVGITINNMSGGYIAGGGGGGAGSLDYGGDDQGHGGGGAGGGDGGGTLSGRQGGTGGAIGASGTNGGGSNGTGGGVGGTAGAAGGGGGGGRILPGSTAAFVDVGSATGGDGGAGGVVGGAGEQLGGSGNGGGGGGGWGAAGGAAYSRSGGAAGAAISGTAVTLTNSGTVYGATA